MSGGHRLCTDRNGVETGMNGFGDYSSGEQIDSLLNQLEEMEQELTDKNEELKDLWIQVQEKDGQIRNLSSGSQKLKSQIQSMKSALSEQGETLRHQTEQLERYSGSDIIFQENGRLKAEMEKAEKRGKEMEERAAAVLAQAGRKEETAERKLAMANRLMAEYEETLAREVEKARRVLQKKLQEDCKRVLRKESVKMSGTVWVLIAAYLAQMAAVLITEKDIIATIPLWFLERCENAIWLLQNLGNLYRSLYQTMITVMPSQLAVGTLFFVSAVIVVSLFFVIRMGACCLLRKWKKRWEYYKCKNMELLKKSVMTGIAFMGFSLSLAVMKIPFIPIRLNVVSWWMIITGIMEYLYFYYDGHDFW